MGEEIDNPAKGTAMSLRPFSAAEKRQKIGVHEVRKQIKRQTRTEASNHGDVLISAPSNHFVRLLVRTHEIT